ncbi:hypothetical protein VPAG_00041 [Vibrio phage douglas 12A4]|uniref:hypothetical protein n=1 Tax=Vibrio phage douglas 12A4 TaxID=573171 RepID=UPI0002C04941|nr:hypothetical protein VPAG_00041 [Vibrio phage douglas 12A4]AGG58077.1 hypothetical protein VPAG_00041 [Vibrio phage douglas 12A4]
MTRKARVSVIVSIPGHNELVKNIELDLFQNRELSPIATADGSLCLNGHEVVNGSFAHLNKLKLRENAAESISNVISKAIIEAIESEDTNNGYKKSE